jgi:hypothetical protein
VSPYLVDNLGPRKKADFGDTDRKDAKKLPHCAAKLQKLLKLGNSIPSVISSVFQMTSTSFSSKPARSSLWVEKFENSLSKGS